MLSRTVRFFGLLGLYGLACRLLPYGLAHLGMPLDPHTTWYPWNFSPLMAICLFSGAGMNTARGTWLGPLAIMVLGDAGIGALTGRWDWAFPRTQAIVYLALALGVGLGWLLRHRPQWSTALPTAVLAEVQFFLITNFAVWWFSEGTYPPTTAGLLACYVAALPFFGRSLFSTLAFTAVLFSPLAWRLAGLKEPSLEAPNTVAALA